MNPFLQPDYLRFWDALAAPTLFIMDGEGEFRVSRKRVARGLASLRRLSLAADEHDWAVELTAQRLTRLNAFAERASWQYGQLLCYADDFAALWPREGILKNCRWRAMPSGDAYLLPIDQGYDSVLAGLTSKARCEIRRKEKKARALSSACRLLNHDGDWQTSLARFYDLHVAFWRERGQQSVFESPPSASA